MDDLLNEFLVECGEGLATLDERLVAYENSPEDSENLKVILRVFHSLKGACGIFGFVRMERLSHVSEDVLVAMRDGRLPVGPVTLAPVLSAVDRLKDLIARIETQKSEPQDSGSEDQPILVSLRDILELAGSPSSPVVTDHGAVPNVSVDKNLEKAAEKPAETAQPLAVAPTAEPAKEAAPPGKSIMDQSLRVSVEILDRLMNLVGELVLSRNQLLQLVSSTEGSPFISPVQQLNRVTSGLQEAVMRTRMQPIGNAWGKLPRIVRDLQGTVGKEIELVMLGAETEIDRQILQAIQDPLTHCVRNSVDHGIELPEARKELGKPSHGTITLRAFQEGGQINIEISDDGAGIDPDRIRAKAIEKGFLSAEQAQRISEADILNLIFEPGFSTAKKVTEISGRGVGMDVVRSNIEKVGGSVELKSSLGEGTTIRIRIPLTLAIVPALIVGVTLNQNSEVFAIPQLAVVELVRMTREGRDRVEELHGSRVLRLRDRLLPLVELAEVLSPGSGPASPSDHGFIIVVQVGESRMGIRVDEIFDTQEIVVKPIGRMVRDIPIYAGSTILGDGRVIMILDAAGVANLANAFSAQGHERAKTDSHSALEGGEEASKSRIRPDESTRLLVFVSESIGAEKTTPMAIPLARVSRLEEADLSSIEYVDGRYVLQYRGTLLPVMRPDDGDISSLRLKEEGKVGVIVAGSIGLLVSEIVDIIDAPSRPIFEKKSGHRRGIAGSTILQNRATEIIDVDAFLNSEGL